MASFSETATLRVIDESSAQIREINNALKDLAKTANALKSKRIDLGVAAKGAEQARSAIRKLVSDAKGLRYVNLTVKANTSQAQSAIRNLRQQASRAATMNVRTSGGGGGMLGRAAGATGGFVYDQFRHGARLLAHEVGRASWEAMKEGANDLSVGEAGIKLKQLGPEKEGQVAAALNRIAAEKRQLPGGEFFSAGQRSKQMSEALGVTNDNVQSAAYLTSRMEELALGGVALGQSMAQADEGAISFAKALEQTGRATYHRDTVDETGAHKRGDFYEKGAKETFEFFQKMQPTIGKEMTGPFARQMVKYLGSGKQAIPLPALGHVLMLGEEEGTRAAVGYRQAQKQLSGRGVEKPQLKNQAKLNEILKASGELPAYKEALKQNDLPKALAIAVKHAKEFGIQMDETGQNFVSPGDASEFAAKFVSNTTAQESLAAQSWRVVELQQKVATAMVRDVSDAKRRQELAGNLRTSVIGMNNQLQSMTGEMAMAFAPIVGPLATEMGGWMAEIGRGFQKAAPDLQKALTGVGLKEGETRWDAAKRAVGTVAESSGAMAEAGAASALIAKAITPLLPMIGTGALVAGVASSDPAVRSLTIAGYQLQQAAQMMMGTGLLKQLGTLMSLIPGLGLVGKAILQAVEAEGRTGDTRPLTEAEQAQKESWQLTERRSAQEQREQQARQQLEKAQQANMPDFQINALYEAWQAAKQAADATKGLIDALPQYGPEGPPLAPEMKQLGDKVEHLTTTVTKAPGYEQPVYNPYAGGKKYPKVAPEMNVPMPIADPRKAVPEEPQPVVLEPPKEPIPVVQEKSPTKLDPVVIEPPKTPIPVVQEKPPAEPVKVAPPPAAKEFPKYGEPGGPGPSSFGQQPGGVSSEFAAQVSQLPNLMEQFPAIFSNGATILGNAGNTLGQQASAILQSGAASAGATLGSTAVATFSAGVQAAVANLNITVNANVKQVNTGANTAVA